MEGGCFCGAVRYVVEGRGRRTTHCHCIHCRRLHAAPFVTWVEVARRGFRIVSGTPAAFESRPRVTRRFCAACGTQLTYENADTAESLDVAVCSLDDPAIVVPEDHVWADRMLPWVKLADRLPRYHTSRTAEAPARAPRGAPRRPRKSAARRPPKRRRAARRRGRSQRRLRS